VLSGVDQIAADCSTVLHASFDPLFNSHGHNQHQAAARCFSSLPQPICHAADCKLREEPQRGLVSIHVHFCMWRRPIIDEELSPDKHLHKPEASASKAGPSAAGATGKGSGPLTMPVPKTDLSAGQLTTVVCCVCLCWHSLVAMLQYALVSAHALYSVHGKTDYTVGGEVTHEQLLLR